MSPARAAAGIYHEGSCTPSETTVRSSVDDAVCGSRFAYDVTARLRSPHTQKPHARASYTTAIVRTSRSHAWVATCTASQGEPSGGV